MIESFVFLGLSLNAWITIVLVLVMFGLLLFTKLPADVVFVGGMAVLLVCGVLPAKEVLSGFSSESVVVVGVLFVVVAGLVYTGVLQWIVRHLSWATFVLSQGDSAADAAGGDAKLDAEQHDSGGSVHQRGEDGSKKLDVALRSC